MIFNIFAAASSTSNTDEALSHIIQLIILCIPLFILPGLIKGSSQIMGKISGAADRFNQGALKKGGGLASKTPGIRNIKENYTDRKAARDYARQKGAARRSVRRGQSSWATAGAGLGSGRADASNYIDAAAIQKEKELFHSDVKAQSAKLEGVDPGSIQAILTGEMRKGKKGNTALARAAQSKLADIDPTMLHSAYLQGGQVTGEMEKALSIGAGEDYGKTAAKDKGAADWFNPNAFGQTQTRTTPSLGDAQLSTQKLPALQRTKVTQEQAQRVLASNNAGNLGAGEREYMEQVASGQASSTSPVISTTADQSVPIAGQFPAPPPAGGGASGGPAGSTPAPTNTGIPHGPQPAPAGYGGGGSPTPPTPGSTSPGGVVIPSADETRRFGS